MRRVRFTGPSRRVGCTVPRRNIISRMYASSDRRAHFGLGAEAKIDHVEIRWPSGIVQRLEHLTVDRIVNVEKPT